MAEPTIAEKPEQWAEIAGQFAQGLIKEFATIDLVKHTEAALVEALGTVVGIVMRLAAPVGTGLAKSIASAEDVIGPAFADLAAQGVNDVFGTNVSAGSFRTGSRGGGAGDELGRILMAQVRGATGPIEPGEAAAAKYVNAMATMALEDWFKGWFFEVASSLIPQLDVGKIESYGALGDKVANVLGLSGISRRVFRPIVDATIVTPLEWHTNKLYRPRLLSASEAARQVARRVWPREKGIEELARQGYSTDRIEALLNAQRKFFSAGDVRVFVSRGHWTGEQGRQHLRDQGYEEDAAGDALRIEGLRRFEQHENAGIASIVSAYADRRIDRATAGGLLNSFVLVPTERALALELAELRRTVNVKRLSISQVEAMVKSGVASLADYRAAAERDGYPPEDIAALDLQLRWEIDKARNIAELRAEAKAQRDADRVERLERAAARRAEVERQRLLERRGPLAKLERAAIRGLIHITRVEEVLTSEYDIDTVRILIDLLEADRVDYLERQARADRAESGARQRGLNLSDVRAALFEQIITPQEFRQRLEQLGLSGADADLLSAVAVEQLEDRLAAERRRADATTAAARRRIDLPRFEMLVRRGARTVTQYGALLADLGFDEPDQAALVDLLQIKIADDAAARQAREAAAAALAARGLSLDQFERAVILGVLSIDDYQRFLLEQGFTPDAQIALVALLRARVTEADAARARRRSTGAGSGGAVLPLATVRRAARLGVIAPDVYAARLEQEGYSADDVAIDLELLLLEIADVQATRARRTDAEGAAAARRLSLAELEQAVKRELAPIEAYRARAAELGYAGDELEILVSLLADELAQLREARARRDTIDGELRARQLSVSQLEDAVKNGLLSVDGFLGELRALGYGADDAELLAALLVLELEAAAAAAGA